MLPEIRTEGDIYPIPQFDVVEDDIEGFVNELRGFHSEFHDCFPRKESRENFFRYMVGQFSDLERKSVEPMALNVEGGKVRPMQHFVSNAVWDESAMLSKYHKMLSEDMGAPDGAVIFDETGFVKKGSESAGVARQYCSGAGKVENSQVGVFTGYASRHGYGLLDQRLFIPEKWFADEYEERRRKCRFPDDLRFRTKPQLAAEMYRKIEEEETVPFRYILGDTIYGNSPQFIETVDESVGKIWFLSVSCDTRCWLKEPLTTTKTYKYKGKKKKKTVLTDTEKKPIKVKTFGQKLNDYFWYRRTVSEGTKGPVEYEFTKRHVVLAKDGLPWKDVWLIIRRTLSKKPEYSYYISNAPLSTHLKTFVWLSGLRWAIEQCFEETKSELGMDHYEVRKLPGWYHHMMITTLAHFFLWHTKIRLGKKSTGCYSVSAQNADKYSFAHEGI